MRKRFIPLLVVIFLIAAGLRVYRLAQVPPHLSNDEISIAYDAYSLLMTGRDEHNQVMPLTFRSHDTYKAPLTAYMLVASTAIFGPGETAARLPSALVGSLTVLVFMILMYRMFQSSKLALVCGLLMTLTPLHIFTSHMVLESNVALFFMITGLIFLFMFLKKRKYSDLWLGVIFEALSVYGYHTEWIFTPLLLLAFFGIFGNQIRPKTAFMAGLMFGILLLPLVVDTLGLRGSSTRANTQNLIYEPTLQAVIHDPNKRPLVKIQTVANAVVSNYFAYWNPGYLFAYGLDIPPKPLTTQAGLFLGICLPFFIGGIFLIRNFPDNQKRFLWIWLLLSPLVPALTKGGANYVRALVMVPPVVVVISIGIKYGWEKIKPGIFRVIFIAFPILLTFGYFCLLYFFHYPLHAGINFAYGYRQAADFINNHPGQFKRIVVDPKFGPLYNLVGVPHLYLAYFTRHDPRMFLVNRRDLSSGLYFSPFEIREINWQGEKPAPDTLYITPQSNLPPVAKTELLEMGKIDYPDETPAFRLYTSADK